MIVLRPQNLFEVAAGNLAFKLRPSCKYVSIRSSLTAHSPLTWQTTSIESQRTSSPKISRVVISAHQW